MKKLENNNNKSIVSEIETQIRSKNIRNFLLIILFITILFNAIFISGVYWSIGSALLAVIIGHFAQYERYKHKVTISKYIVFFCLIVGYLFISFHIYSMVKMHYAIAIYEKTKNQKSIHEVPNAQGTLNTSTFSSIDGIAPGMNVKEALKQIRKTHNDVKESKGYFVYYGSELGEKNRVTVWSWERRSIVEIEIKYPTDDISTFDECKSRFNYTFNQCVEKYGKPYYHIRPKIDSKKVFYRYYYCFGDNVHIYHNMIDFGSLGCEIKTIMREGLCSRAISEFFEVGKNSEIYSIETIKE